MEKTKLVSLVNGKLSKKVGYNPFIFKNGKVLCVSCRKEHTNLDEESLLKTKTVRNYNGDPVEVHSCPGCKYVSGVNVSLKKRISDIRKELSLYELPAGIKFKNDYLKPQNKYKFIVPETDEVVEISEDDMYTSLRNIREGRVPENTVSSEEEKTPLSEEDAENADIEFEQEDSPEEEVSHIEVEQDEGSSEVPETATPKTDFFNDDEDDLSDIFNNDDKIEESDEISTEEEEVVVEEPEVVEEVPVVEKVKSVKVEAITTEEVVNDDIDSFFNSDHEDVSDEETINFDSNNAPGGVSDVKVEKDPQIEAMLKQNSEYAEEDVFRIEDRKEHVYNIIRNSRITDLTESYSDSNAKVLVDRILALFEKRGKKVLKHRLYINEATRECPVVDFEGNIRLIFVNIDIPGGSYNIEGEVNSKVRPTFPDTSEYSMITYVIFSDMIESHLLNRVVRAVSKNIAFNLKVKNIFKPISIIKDSDRYFYTTDEYDKDAIFRFNADNSAGNVDKPHNGEIACLSHWNNPGVDDMWKYRKEMQNRATLARGGNVDYEDLSMFVTCSMKYIVLPQTQNGIINVTIVDYVECLDLFVRDGFGALVGILVHKVKTDYPNSLVNLYYELDISTIPSPTISRYVKNGSIRNIDVNQDLKQLNSIIEKVSKQNGSTKTTTIPIEGEPFNTTEYNNNFWSTYVLAPEYRRTIYDNKRIDWRRFGRKTITKTLGDRFKERRNINLNDKRARKALLEEIGYQTVIQPQVVKTRVTDNFGRNALATVMQTCSGIFSIKQYVKSNRSAVVDDNYMNNRSAPAFNAASGSYMTPEQFQYQQQMMAAYQQQMMQQQMMGGGFNR